MMRKKNIHIHARVTQAHYPHLLRKSRFFESVLLRRCVGSEGLMANCSLDSFAGQSRVAVHHRRI